MDIEFPEKFPTRTSETVGSNTTPQDIQGVLVYPGDVFRNQAGELYTAVEASGGRQGSRLSLHGGGSERRELVVRAPESEGFLETYSQCVYCLGYGTHFIESEDEAIHLYIGLYSMGGTETFVAWWSKLRPDALWVDAPSIDGRFAYTSRSFSDLQGALRNRPLDSELGVLEQWATEYSFENYLIECLETAKTIFERRFEVANGGPVGGDGSTQLISGNSSPHLDRKTVPRPSEGDVDPISTDVFSIYPGDRFLYAGQRGSPSKFSTRSGSELAPTEARQLVVTGLSVSGLVDTINMARLTDGVDIDMTIPEVNKFIHSLQGRGGKYLQSLVRDGNVTVVGEDAPEILSLHVYLEHSFLPDAEADVSFLLSFTFRDEPDVLVEDPYTLSTTRVDSAEQLQQALEDPSGEVLPDSLCTKYAESEKAVELCERGSKALANMVGQREVSCHVKPETK
jgi:hypothetical protein